jgi:hypothetical protein
MLQEWARQGLMGPKGLPLESSQVQKLENWRVNMVQVLKMVQQKETMEVEHMEPLWGQLLEVTQPELVLEE